MISNRVRKTTNSHSDASTPPPNPPGFIGMDSAENWLIRPDELPAMKSAIQRDFGPEDLNYPHNPAGEPPLLQGAASFVKKFFAPKVPVLPEDIVCQGGAFEILYSLVYCICDQGDGLLIDAPFWPGFESAARLRNDSLLVEVERPESFANIDEVVMLYERALANAKCNIRGLICCNPINPTGHIYPVEYLEAMLKFCEKHDLHFISDEIYGLSTWGGPKPGSNPRVHPQQVFESSETQFTSVLSLDLKKLKVNPSRVHLVYGISKDLGSSGLRVGFLITQKNPEIREAVASAVPYPVSRASSVMATALFSDLVLAEYWLAKSRILLRASASYVEGFMQFHNIPFYRPVAGLVIWARLGGLSATTASDIELWASISAAGAALAYGASFHEKEPGWFRITFALPRKDLVEGFRRIEVGLGARQRYRPDDAFEEAGQDLV